MVQIISEGDAPGGHNPPGRARTPMRVLVGCGPHVAPSLISLAHIITHLQKKSLLSLSRVLALKPTGFDLFARSSVSETVSGDCCLVCNSTVCPISFCFGGLYFE